MARARLVSVCLGLAILFPSAERLATATALQRRRDRLGMERPSMIRLRDSFRKPDVCNRVSC
jgi:hypothetical protein